MPKNQRDKEAIYLREFIVQRLLNRISFSQMLKSANLQLKTLENGVNWRKNDSEKFVAQSVDADLIIENVLLCRTELNRVHPDEHVWRSAGKTVLQNIEVLNLNCCATKNAIWKR